MRSLKLKGIIIGKKDFGEQDRLFKIFTENNGKLEVVAKNVRNGSSKRNGHLELFNYGIFFLYRSTNHFYLNQCTTIAEFPLLKSNLETIGSAYLIAEILDGLTPVEQPSRKIFENTLGILKKLEEKPLKNEILLLAYKIKLLSELGVLPHVIQCGNCGNKLASRMSYVPGDHAFYCPSCIKKPSATISPTSIKLFYFLFKSPLSEAVKIKNNEALSISLRELSLLLDILLSHQ